MRTGPCPLPHPTYTVPVWLSAVQTDLTMPIKDVLDRLEDAERRWAGAQFFAPVLPGRPVKVRIAGMVCTVRTVEGLPRDYAGWAVLQAMTTGQAAFVRAATLAEREQYLALFPTVRLILVETLPANSTGTDSYWLARPAHVGDQRLRITGSAPLLLPEEGLERFDTVVARFDGRLLWYDRRDVVRDPALAAYLRERFAARGADDLPPQVGALRKPGLSAEERAAYAFARSLIELAARDWTEVRLSEALAHAQGRLRSYSEHGDVYTVTYEVDGEVHTSAVRRDDLSVTTAGICLSGQDRRFDLTSLVGVMREAGN
jgi:hypothetical protein